MLILNGEIDDNMLEKAAAYYRDFNEAVIYLSSPGGFVSCQEALLHMFNTHNTKLYCYGEIASCALELFIKAKCYKELLPGTTGMAHLHYRKLHVTQNGNIHKEDNFYFEDLGNSKDETSALFKPLLTVKEFRKLEAGEDVYLSHERMMKIWQKTQA